MIQPLRKPVTPSFSTSMPGSRKYHDLVRDVDNISKYLKFFTGPYLNQLLQAMVTQLNTQVQGVGDPLPSAATIIPTNAIHHVTGTAVISTINVPSGFSGPIFLIADDVWSMDTSGNIALPVNPSLNSLVLLVYDYVSAKWYPLVAVGSGGPSNSRAGHVTAPLGSPNVAIAFGSNLAMPYVPMVSLEGNVGTTVRVVAGSETASGFTAKLGVTPSGTDNIIVNYAAFAI